MILAPALVLVARPCLAVQGHGGPEGLYGHQLAHVFFLVSMALLVFWLRRWKLAFRPGWRAIQWAALLFIAWNIDAFAAHLLEEHLQVVKLVRGPGWSAQVQAAPGWQWIAVPYYLLKLDHLLCVPAMVCLLLGLWRLSRPGSARLPEQGAS